MTEHDFGPEPTAGMETVARRKTLPNSIGATGDSPITGPYIRFGTYIGNNDVSIKHRNGPDTIEHVSRLKPGEEIKPGDEVVVNNRHVPANETGRLKISAFFRKRRNSG